LPQLPVRDALRAVLFNQSARGAPPFLGCAVLRRAVGEVAFVPSGMIAKLDDLVCGRVHVFRQRTVRVSGTSWW
jgi:hypothetical protein